jgi:lipid II:glycine glycyltransferase (peptidoglycan interpeptide bridge formation enzyme)
MLPIKVSLYNGVLKKLSSRMILYGGIMLCEKNISIDAINTMLTYYEKYCAEGSLFTEIRNMNNTDKIRNRIIKTGFDYEDYLNFIIDLREKPKYIFRNFSKGRKSDIKALQKKNISVKEITTAKEIDSIYDILSATYSKIQIPIADISLFEKTFEYLYNTGNAKFFAAKLHDKIVAVLVALLYNKRILTWYYANNIEFRRLSATSLLIWNLIERGFAEKFEILDFGGAGKPSENYGVRDYKARFGGKQVNYGRYKKIHYPTLFNFAKKGFEVYRKLL